MSGSLKFLSGKYQGGEFPLEAEIEIVIGRSSELDMVLVEDIVSRRHARITAFHGEVEIEDLESLHGTFVNGERITKVRLHEGDRIMIGTNIMRYDSTSSESFQSEPVYRMGVVQPSSWSSSDSQRIHSSEVSLVDLMQLFETSRRTCKLCYEPHDSVRIYIKQGVLHWVTFQDEPDPYIAFARILALDDEIWTIDSLWDGADVSSTPLDISIAAFVMDVETKLQERAAHLGHKT